jgi:hypothetical protein
MERRLSGKKRFDETIQSLKNNEEYENAAFTFYFVSRYKKMN